MKDKIVQLFYYTKCDIRIPALSDFIDYVNIPLLVNFNIFKLNLINGFINNFDGYFFLFNEDEKMFLSQIEELKDSKKISLIDYFEENPNSNLSARLKNALANFKDNYYILFTPLTYLTFFSLKDLKFNNKEGIRLRIENGCKDSFLINMKYFKKKVLSEGFTNTEELYSLLDNNIKTITSPYRLTFAFRTLKEYFLLHFKILERNSDLKNFVAYLNTFLNETQPIHLDRSGVIKNSIVGNGTEIKGKVFDSIIFNNVIIMNNTEIFNSIILPGNIIGKKTFIKNSLIGYNKNPNKLITIGNGCLIGKSSGKNYKNLKYSSELPDGFSIIGNNIVIPSNFKVGKHCVIRGGVPYSRLKKIGILVDGGTIEEENSIQKTFFEKR